MLLGMPISLISFLDDRREWFKSVFGCKINELSRDGSICSEVVRSSEILEARDARQDSRFSKCLMVTGEPRVRFYAAVPLISPLGFRLGALCVADHVERRLDDDQRKILRDLSALVIDELELHRTLHATWQNRLQAALDDHLFRPRSDQSFAFVAVLQPDGTLIDADEAPANPNQQTLKASRGKPLWECDWWSDIPEAWPPLQHAIERAADGHASRFDAMIQPSMSAYSSIDLMLAPMRDADGRVTYLIASGSDVSDRKSTELRLRQCEIRFRGTFENVAVGMAHVSLNSRWLYVNHVLLDILGYTKEELLTKTLPEITHSDDLAGHLVQFSRLKVGDIDNYTREKRYVRKDGTFVWVNVTVSLQRAENNNPLFAIMVIEDITSRKETEERQRLLLGELNHRVKNIMSMMQSIANQSLRYSDSTEHFVTSFQSRLQAMARAHDLLTQESWQRADLAELVMSQTTASGMVEPSRIHADGPGIFLSGQVALNFALVLHELTSNALKYGALSTMQGHVDVSWTVEGTGAGRIVHMIWQEKDGPRVRPPNEKGFGTILIDRSLRQALGADVQMKWPETGMVLHIDLPLPEVTWQDTYFNP